MATIRHESPPEPDCRTSPVGTKRSFDLSATSESNIIEVDFSSEDEMFDNPQKKICLSKGEGSECQAMHEVFKSNENVVSDQKNFELKSRQLVESAPADSPIHNPDPPPTELLAPNIISWNKGIQGRLRTSFESRTTLQVHKQYPVSLSFSDSAEPKNKKDGSLRLSTVQNLPPHALVGQSPIESFLNATNTSMSPDDTATDDSASKQGRRVRKATTNSESRIATNTASRERLPVHTEGHVEFELPINKGGARKEFDNVKFLRFVPRFMTMNREKVPKMSPTTPMRAFETYLNSVYRDISQDQIEMKLNTMPQHKEKWFNIAVKRATGNTRMQLGMVEPHTPQNSTKEHRSTSNAQHALLGDHPTRFSDGDELPVAVARTASCNIRNGMDVTTASSVFHVNNSNSSMNLEENITSLHTLVNLSRPAISSTVATHQNGTLQEKGQVLYDACNAQPQVTSDQILHPTSEKQVSDVSMMDSIAEGSQTKYDADELILMHRYYPGNTKYPFTPRCLTCSNTGHNSSQCPQLKCGFCGFTGLHFKSGCPKYRFCTKCHRRGHSNQDCEEKLKEISGLASCAMCNSTKHFEEYCHFQWRSFRSNPATAVLAQDIPMFCYFCGNNSRDGRPAHYGADCGIRRGQIQSGGYTWSRTNWERYVDPQSNLRASSNGKGYKIHSKKGLSIKGSANNPITISHSDEELGGSFIDRQVARQPRPEPRGKQHIQLNHQALSNPFQPSWFDEVLQPSSGIGLHSQRLNTSGGQGQLQNNPSYQKRDDSARQRREQSFSPPPQYPQYRDGYQPPLPPGSPPPRLNTSYRDFHASVNLGPYQGVPPSRDQVPPRRGGQKQKKKRNKKHASAQGVTGSPRVKKPRGNGHRPAGRDSAKRKRGGGSIGA